MRVETGAENALAPVDSSLRLLLPPAHHLLVSVSLPRLVLDSLSLSLFFPAVCRCCSFFLSSFSFSFFFSLFVASASPRDSPAKKVTPSPILAPAFCLSSVAFLLAVSSSVIIFDVSLVLARLLLSFRDLTSPATSTATETETFPSGSVHRSRHRHFRRLPILGHFFAALVLVAVPPSGPAPGSSKTRACSLEIPLCGISQLRKTAGNSLAPPPAPLGAARQLYQLWWSGSLSPALSSCAVSNFNSNST